MGTHKVVRAFSGGAGKKYQGGDDVDASLWPLREALESQGYIEPIRAGDKVSASQADHASRQRGRKPAAQSGQEVE